MPVSRATVTENFDLPDGSSPDPQVRYFLAGTGGRPIAEAYDADGNTIVSELTATVTAGATSVDLVGNGDITPANTVWARSVNGSVAYIEVPTDGSTVAVPDILTDPPAALESSALAAFKASLLASGGAALVGVDSTGWTNLSGATVQAALASADTAISGAGQVDSVNGETGVVVLDADDISDVATTNKFATETELNKLAGIETGADVTDATNVAAAGAVMEADTSTASMSFVIDEDDMASDSATKVPTQQSVKAYADTKADGGTLFGYYGFVASRYYPAILGSRVSSFSMTNDTEFASPFAVGQTTTFDRIGINVTVAGSSGSVIRLGIKTMGADGRPADLVLDAGTVDGTSTGVNPITISEQLEPGAYWLVAVGQGSPSTAPTVTGGEPTGTVQIGHPTPTLAATTLFAAPSQTGVSGALSSGGTWTGINIRGPVVLLRAT